MGSEKSLRVSLQINSSHLKKLIRVCKYCLCTKTMYLVLIWAGLSWITYFLFVVDLNDSINDSYKETSVLVPSATMQAWAWLVFSQHHIICDSRQILFVGILYIMNQ